MSKIKQLEENAGNIVEDFKKYVCADCLVKLERVAQPIDDRLKSGEKLRFKDTKALVGCLCHRCRSDIYRRAKSL